MAIYFPKRDRGFALSMNSSFFGFFAHAGFLAGLAELDLVPRRVAGASAGALAGAFFAAGFSPEQILEIVRRPQLAAVFREWRGPARIFGALLNRRGFTGALSGRRALAMLREYFGDRRIEDCDIPFACSVANVSNATSEIAERGPLANFVLASCAVPGMFAAQEIGGHHYWDGGVADPIPFEHWIDDERAPRRILIHLVINPEEVSARRNPDVSFYGGLSRCHQIISDEVFRLKMDLARRAKREVLVLRTLAPRPGPTKLHLGDVCVELGRQTALANAEELKKWR